MIVSPFLFVAWTVSVCLSQAQRQTSGWLSVMGWALWVKIGLLSCQLLWVVPFLWQWTASIVFIIQRWASDLGSIAHRIDDLNGCTPVDGLGYLQQGMRSHSFKILQSVTFSVATGLMAPSTKHLNINLAMPALAELIYAAYVAAKGTPVVVSGNCMLVELNPSKVFLDSLIETRWKAFSTMMGF